MTRLERFSKNHSSEGLADALVGGFEEYCAECEKRGGRLCGRRTDSENRNLLLKCFARWASEECDGGGDRTAGEEIGGKGMIGANPIPDDGYLYNRFVDPSNGFEWKKERVECIACIHYCDILRGFNLLMADINRASPMITDGEDYLFIVPEKMCCAMKESSEIYDAIKGEKESLAETIHKTCRNVRIFASKKEYWEKTNSGIRVLRKFNGKVSENDMILAKFNKDRSIVLSAKRLYWKV